MQFTEIFMEFEKFHPELHYILLITLSSERLVVCIKDKYPDFSDCLNFSVLHS